jgi:hypothetical protein
MESEIQNIEQNKAAENETIEGSNYIELNKTLDYLTSLMPALHI